MPAVGALPTCNRAWPRGQAAGLDREAGFRDHRAVVALDNCIQWIVSLVETGNPNAVRLSVAEADAYLASFDDVRDTKTRRDELVDALRKTLPRDALANQIIGAIEQGERRDLTNPARAR